jgi:hypothetical protein
MVCGGQKAATAALGQAQKSADPQATALARAFRRRLEEVQPVADRRTAGCLHRCGGQAALPATPGPIGLPHRAAVFDSPGIRSEGRRKQAEGRKCCGSPANTGDFAINTGYTPARHRYDTSTTPEQAGGGRQSTRRNAATEDRKAEGNGSFGIASKSATYDSNAVAGSPPSG